MVYHDRLQARFGEINMANGQINKLLEFASMQLASEAFLSRVIDNVRRVFAALRPGRIRGLSGLRHPRQRLPAPDLRHLRPRHPGRLQLQAARHLVDSTPKRTTG